jgi:NAD(P)-dependent dehydrogenase (short-subunit alcohol dehydrogenase family)
MNLPFMIDLKNKTAVVTGGGGILCSQFAKALALCGARVAVLDLRLEFAEHVASEIRSAGGEAIAAAANVLDKESLLAARAEVLEAFGPCSILINGAGGNNPRATTSKEYLLAEDLLSGEGVNFLDMDPANFESVMNLNILGTVIPTQVFARDMIGRPGAVIINISSMNAFRPLTKVPAYSSAKAAVSNFTQWLAVHFSRAGIRVNAIAPGFFLTQQNQKLLIDEQGNLTERSRKIINMTPMGRFGKEEDLIGTLLWLASEEASGFVNGAVIPVDGGFAAYSGV